MYILSSNAGLPGATLKSGELWSVNRVEDYRYTSQSDMLTYTTTCEDWYCWRLIHDSDNIWWDQIHIRSSLCWSEGKRARFTGGRNVGGGRVLSIRMLRCWRSPALMRYCPDAISFKPLLHRRLFPSLGGHGNASDASRKRQCLLYSIYRTSCHRGYYLRTTQRTQLLVRVIVCLRSPLRLA